jgi:hypothetical protein
MEMREFMRELHGNCDFVFPTFTEVLHLITFDLVSIVHQFSAVVVETTAGIQILSLLNIILAQPFMRPCHSSGSQLLASHCSGPGLNPGQVMWDLWWTECH